MTFLFELLPLAFFFGAYSIGGIYTALGTLMVAMPIGLIAKRLYTGQLDKMYFWSTVMLLVAGGLTLYFRNPLFLYWKPTVFCWAVAVIFLLSQFFGDKPLVHRFFGSVDGIAFKGLESQHWLRLNMVWVIFFAFMGALNIYVAYNFPEQTWVTFKAWGFTGLTFVFVLAQTLWLAKYIDDSEEQVEAD